MQARSFGAVLMIALGSVVLVSPLGSSTGSAGLQDPCAEENAPGAPIDPCDPCEEPIGGGAAIDPCVADTVPTDTTPIDTTPIDTTPRDTTPAATTPADNTPESGLPSTGRDSTPLALGAGTLLIVGGLALLASRRRGEPVTPR